MLLHHGTTRLRAEAIMKGGPDPDFREPGEVTTAEGFSTARPAGPFAMGDPETMARGKAVKFPRDGGPVILEIDVPDDVIRIAFEVVDEVRFLPGYGLEELLQIWPSLPMRILPLP
jgi:hypothetical protein